MAASSPRRCLVRLALAAGMTASLGARDVAAEARPSITYVAPDGCPTEAAFHALLLRRMRPGLLAKGPAAIVGIAPSGTGFHGSLMFRDTSGTVTSREVNAPSCEEVASALALVTAMVLDEAASSAPPEPPPAARTEPWRWALGAGVVAQGAIAPTMVFGPRLSAELRAPDRGSAPAALRLAAAYVTGGEAPVSGTITARFSAVTAQLQGCLRPRPAEGSLRMEACLGGQVGLVDVTDVPLRTSRVWGAVQAAVGASYAFFPDLSVHAHLAALVPLTRDTYVVRGSPQVIHRPALLAPEGGLSLIYVLP